MPTIDRVAFSIFGVDIYWYAIIIVIGMVVGVFSALFLAKRKGFKIDDILDIIIWVIPIAIVGARLYYVITDWDETWTFARIFAMRDGGLAIYGGVIAGCITAIIVARVKKFSWRKLLNVLDVFVVGVIIGQCIGRWGNFVNQEAYGQLITNPNLQFFPMAVFVNGSWYHATFFYESLWNFIGFIALFILNYKKPQWTGISTCGYFAYYGIGRAWIEGLRSDSLYFLKNILGETIRISQVLSIILVVAAVVAFIMILRYSKKHPEKSFFVAEKVDNVNDKKAEQEAVKNTTEVKNEQEVVDQHNDDSNENEVAEKKDNGDDNSK